MITVSDACIRCRACIDVCPIPGTISRSTPGKVRINTASCIECKLCLPVCPTNALKSVSTPRPVKPIEEKILPIVETVVELLQEQPEPVKKPTRKRGSRRGR